MKRIIASLIPLLLLSGCINKNTYKLNLTVAAPAGAPSACLYKYLSDQSHVEILKASEAGNLTSYMEHNQKDIVILPTNAGVMTIKNKNVDYKIAATITFGNLFIGATGNDEDGVMNDGDYVVLIQKNNVPDKLFQYLYGDLSLDTHYLETPTSSPSTVLATGLNNEDNNHKVDYVLIAEPAFTAAKTQNPNVSEYASIQDQYKVKTGNKEIMQASIFVSNSANKQEVDKFLDQLEKDINSFIINPDVLDEYVKDFDDVTFAAKFGVANANMLKRVTLNGNRMGLGYKKAKDNKEAIDQFLTLWPVIGETSEEIYY